VEVSLRSVRFTCGRCGTTYRDGLLLGGYGRLVVRDATGRHPSVADLMADPLVDLLGQVAGERAALFARVATTPADVQGAYLRLCDPSPAGLPWDRDALPCCPSCGAQPTAHERLEELLTTDLPLLRHGAFDALPREQQRAAAAGALTARVPSR